MTDFLDICKNGTLKEVKDAYFESKHKLFAINKNGDTAVHIAIKEKNVELLETLLKLDLMMDINNKKGENPYHLILNSENNQILDVFCQYYPIDGFLHYFNNMELEEYVSNKDFLKYLKENYLGDQEDIIYEDDDYLKILKNDGALAAELLLPSTHDSDSLLTVLEYSIQSEYFSLSKKIMIDLYKKHNNVFKSNIENIIRNIILKEDKELLSFLIDLVDFENINQKTLSDSICLYSSIDMLIYFSENYLDLNDKDSINRLFLGSIVRNSIIMTQFLINKYSLKLPEKALYYSLQIESDEKYMIFLKNHGFTFDASKQESKIIELMNSKNQRALFNLIKVFPNLLNFKGFENHNLLHMAVVNRNYILTDFLIPLIENPNHISDYGLSPLMMAIEDKKMMMVFLKHHDIIDFDTFDNTANSLLNILVQKGDINTIKMILPYVKNINFYNVSGFNPLLMAINKNEVEIVEILIKYNCDVNALFNNTSSALDFSIYMGHQDIENILKAHKSQSYDNMKNNPIVDASLEDAVLSKDIEKTSFILASYIKDSVKYNNTSLPNKVKDINMFRLLLIFGFDVNGIGLEYPTPLMNAIIDNNTNLVTLLIDNGAFINNSCEIDNEMQNCLSLAIKNNNIVIIKKLLDAKIDIDFKSLSVKDDGIFTLIKSSLPIRKIKKLNVYKTKYNEKVSLFKSIQKEKYIIEKNDNPYIVDVKKLLNILDESSSFDDFIHGCKEEGFSLSFMIEKQSFEDIRFDSQYNTLTLEDLGITISTFKKIVSYDFFKDFNKMIKNIFLTERNDYRDLTSFNIFNNSLKDKITEIYTINQKKVGYMYEGKRTDVFHPLLTLTNIKI